MTFALGTQFHVYLPGGVNTHSEKCLNVLNVKAVLATLNQEKALVGAFSVLRRLIVYSTRIFTLGAE